ncbi:MAG TPA: PAS domain S-box protein [Nitrospirota bacterium]|nr:PAS domain S-box protein [Nitrospirota bacterium]
MTDLFSAANYHLPVDALPLLATAIVYFMIATLGAVREGGVIGRSLLALGATVVIWFSSAFLLRCSLDEQTAVWWSRAIYIGVPLMPAALYHFTVLFLKTHSRYSRIVRAGWLLAVFFAALFAGTDVLIDGVRHFSWGYRPRFTLFSAFFLLYFLVLIGMSVYRYFRDFQTSEPGGIHRKRTLLLLIGFAIASGGFVDYLSNAGLAVYPFGFLPMLAGIVFISYTMWTYRLVDITPQFAAQNVLDTMNDALLVLDADGIIRLVNRAAIGLFGFAEQDFLGKQISSVLGDAGFAARFARTASGDDFLHQELVSHKPGADDRTLDLSASVMKDDNKRSLAHVLIIRDITHVKRAEAELIKARDELELRVEERSSELRHANEQLEQEKSFSETIIDGLPGIFFMCDDAGRFLRWNANEKEVTGYSELELSRMDVYGLFPQDRDLLAAKMREVLEAGQSFMEILLVTKSGISIPFYVTAYRMVINNTQYIVGMGINISDRKKLEEQFHQAQKMEAVGLLAGGVAHDFNNILSAIIGYAHITLMKLAEDDPLRHNLEQILESADRAAVLTQSLLAFSRKQSISPAVIDMNIVAKNIEKLLHRLIREDIVLETRYAAAPLFANVDRGQIEQILMNLATNARDAMPEGGRLTITTSRFSLTRRFIETHGYGKEGEYVCISVSDTGLGMDEHTASHAFEPFFTTKGPGKGTGLGLSTVYGIIKRHDGFVELSTAKGHGATFHIYLPIAASAVETTAEKESAPLNLRGGTETILVAEDDEVLRRLNVEVLTQFGYAVIEAGDGIDAVAKFKEDQQNIRLVILDGIMPRMKGFEALNEIRAVCPAVKCIFLSGYSEDIFSKVSAQAGQAELIIKPVSPVNLLKKVREVLDRSI